MPHNNQGGVFSMRAKLKNFFVDHPFLFSILAALVAGEIITPVYLICTTSLQDSFLGHFWEVLYFSLFWGALVAAFVVYPGVLMLIELFLFFYPKNRMDWFQKGRIFDILGVFLGAMYSGLYLICFNNADITADWDVQLYNASVHTPVFTGAWLTVGVIALVAVCGYLLLAFLPLSKFPPLAAVLCLSAMYLGTGECILWAVQTMTDFSLNWPLLLLPIYSVLVTARTVLIKMEEWRALSGTASMEKITRVPFLAACNRLLSQAKYWPVAAFLLMWPLLGILVALLLLFGQAPDSAIKAWTETAEWNLSNRVAPQNIYYDEHYLCTVAAGGHKKVVRPLRLGTRHGHEVIVNRQLCIANAFEQILEDYTPRFHRLVRHIYDTYGFPVAKLIHSKYTADVVYFIMKPLEWIFLLVLYLVDVHPENRIALQYTGKSLTDF
jgi:hypothetical protein